MQNRRVTIIDDDKKLLGEIEEILLMAGYAPVPVVDAVSAMDVVIQNKPDVILMELKLPRKNGFELTHEINRVFETKRVPVIAMSALFRDEFHWLFDLCGIRRCLKKPFQPLDLIWAIESELEKSN